MNLEKQIKDAEMVEALEYEALKIAERDYRKAAGNLVKLMLKRKQQYSPVKGVTDK